MFQTEVAEKIKKTFHFKIIFFYENGADKVKHMLYSWKGHR
jgi:hypothetical protein